MVVIDSDVLLLAFTFFRDRRQPSNRAFLEVVQTVQPATTIYNVMEVLGQLSFNLSPKRLVQWQSWFIDTYQLTVIWMEGAEKETEMASFQEELMKRPFQKILTQRIPIWMPWCSHWSNGPQRWSALSHGMQSISRGNPN